MPRLESSIPINEAAESTHRMLLGVRQRYGMSRLEMGLLLHTQQEYGFWQGKAESFWHYVDDLRLNRSACRTYMRVAKKFILELNVSESILHQLASVNMSVLDKAATYANIDNAADIISIVLALHERDAKFALEEHNPQPDKSLEVDNVGRVIGRYMELPDDLRIDFMNRLRQNNQTSIA